MQDNCRNRSEGLFVRSKKEGKDQASIQLSTTPDPGYHLGK